MGLSELQLSVWSSSLTLRASCDDGALFQEPAQVPRSVAMLGLRVAGQRRHELVSKALVRVLEALVTLARLRLALPQTAQQHSVFDELAHRLAPADVDLAELLVGAAAELLPVVRRVLSL